eukprot:TRINITY_DN3153_c2_g1_i1.p1 TRINITY_DN3153_c2_g1~~TRINITY_DN3153_c2_g1_i1.p1  ORF type:complete len:156 (+),score=27.20 TRINITY_DN3153_c2_g1_i1:55-468(+)
MVQENPISANPDWRAGNRPSDMYSVGPESPTSPTALKIKEAGSEIAGKGAALASEGAKKCCTPEVKEQFHKLTIYTATILMALAWWDFVSTGIFHQMDEGWGENLGLLWAGAAICIILAMVVTYFTGETLAFGEDCC